MELKLSKYKACICEGSAENAIIDILVDEHLLIFEREEMLDGEVIRIRDAKKFESRYLRRLLCAGTFLAAKSICPG